MELIDVIEKRSSIRNFKDKPIAQELIMALLKAGRCAPSGMNLQPTRYIVIQSNEAKEALKECTPLSFVSQAPLILAVCIDKEAFHDMDLRLKELKGISQAKNNAIEDKTEDLKENHSKRRNMDENEKRAYLKLNAAIAIDHITLRAVDLGLGSCWVMMFDSEKVKTLLNMEKKYEVVALLPIGYADEEPKTRSRIDLDDLLLEEV
ncbi:MAG: nitroreductase family protein [Eubacteriales bacterium]